MKDESDALLVRRILGGETHVYGQLVERYRDRLGRYAVRMLGNAADAEDVLQETFVRGYRSLGRCRPEGFREWLFGILVNRCRTYAAQRARRQQVFANSELGANVAASAFEEYNGWRQTLAWAIGQLPAEQREAFLLRHVEDLSYEEMQAMTGARIPALKMRVFRAREVLRNLLEEKVLG